MINGYIAFAIVVSIVSVAVNRWKLSKCSNQADDEKLNIAALVLDVGDIALVIGFKLLSIKISTIDVVRELLTKAKG